MCISIFQLYLWEYSKYLDYTDISVYIYRYIVLRKSQILEKFISLGLFLLQVTAGFTVFVEEYPEYTFYSDLSIILFLDLDRGGKSQISLSSSKMAKFATASLENPEFSGLDCKMHTIKKINHKFLIEFFSYTADIPSI